MEEKDLKQIQTSDSGNVTEGNEQYLAAIKELKEKSVSKDDYLKLKEENKNLLATLVDGGQMGPVAPAKPDKEVISELRSEIFDKNNELSNLEYVTKVLELRDTLVNNGQRDPFLPVGEFCVVEQSDIDKAGKVAEILKECIDYADGNSAIFTDEFQRRLIEVKPSGKRK